MDDKFNFFTVQYTGVATLNRLYSIGEITYLFNGIPMCILKTLYTKEEVMDVIGVMSVQDNIINTK